MPRQLKDAVTSVRLDRNLLLLYQEEANRPSLSELLTFAITAYLGVESDQEVMYRNVLEAKRQMQKSLLDKQQQQLKLEEEAEIAAARAEEEKENAVRSALGHIMVLNPSRKLLRNPKTAEEKEHNEDVRAYLTMQIESRHAIPQKEVGRYFEKLYWEIKEEES